MGYTILQSLSFLNRCFFDTKDLTDLYLSLGFALACGETCNLFLLESCSYGLKIHCKVLAFSDNVFVLTVIIVHVAISVTVAKRTPSDWWRAGVSKRTAPSVPPPLTPFLYHLLSSWCPLVIRFKNKKRTNGIRLANSYSWPSVYAHHHPIFYLGNILAQGEVILCACFRRER